MFANPYLTPLNRKCRRARSLAMLAHYTDMSVLRLSCGVGEPVMPVRMVTITLPINRCVVTASPFGGWAIHAPRQHALHA